MTNPKKPDNEKALTLTQTTLPVYFREEPVFASRADFIKQAKVIVTETRELAETVRRAQGRGHLNGIRLGQCLCAWASHPEAQARLAQVMEERKGQRGKPPKPTSILAREIADDIQLKPEWLEKCVLAWERYRDSGFTLKPDVNVLANSRDPEKAELAEDGEDAGTFDPKRALTAPEDIKKGSRTPAARAKKATSKATSMIKKIDTFRTDVEFVKKHATEETTAAVIEAVRKLANELGIKLAPASAKKPKVK